MGKKDRNPQKRDPAYSMEESFSMAPEITSARKGTSANGKGQQEGPPSHIVVTGSSNFAGALRAYYHG